MKFRGVTNLTSTTLKALLFSLAAILSSCAPQPYFEVGAGVQVTSASNDGDDWQYGQIINEHKTMVLELILDNRYYRSDFEIERSPRNWGDIRKVVVGPGDRLSVGIRTKSGAKCVWLVVRETCCEPRLRARSGVIDANPTNAGGYGWKIWMDKGGRVRYSP